MVVSINDEKINKDSLQAWSSNTLQERLKKVADELYELRSKFTHNNIRSFLPLMNLDAIPDLSGRFILCKKTCSIDLLFNEVIKELCLNKFEK
jgi:hypothetical protein